MKRCTGILRIGLLALMAGVTGCATSGNGARSASSTRDYNRSSTVVVDNPSIPLDDYLRRVPGVQVYGSGSSASVKINGVSSLMMSTAPLFVVDGVRVGRSFSNVYSLLSMSMVDHIQVLKRAEASYYGVEGANGVILITTKNGPAE